MAGINIDVAVNSRAAVGGVKDLSSALDDTADALDEMVDASRRAGTAGDKAMSTTERGADDTGDAVQQLERNFRDLTMATQRQDTAADRAATSSKKGFREAGGAAEEFRSEALANFSEVTSSFDGSMSSIVDLAQGTFGGLATMGGPIGLALGGLGAIIGAVFTGMTANAEAEAQKTQQAIADMFADMTESGKDYLSDDFITQKIKDLVTDHDQLQKAQEGAAAAGVSVSTVLRAMAGDQEAINDTLAAAATHYGDLAQAQQDAGGTATSLTSDQQAQLVAIQDLQKALGDVATDTGSAAAQAEIFRQATSYAEAAMGKQTEAAQKLQGSLDALHDVNVKVNVDDAVAREHLRQIGQAINVDLYVTPRTGRGVN